MKKNANYSVLMERITLAVLANCMAGGERRRRMWEFATRYGNKPQSDVDLEAECRRILNAGVGPQNIRRVLTAILQVQLLPRNQDFVIIGFPRANQSGQLEIA
jgi:hypothetical protein